MMEQAVAAGHPDVSGPALEAQYFMRGAVPAWKDYMDEWDVWSDAVRAGFPVHLNRAYGETAAEKLDVILPRAPVQGAPVQFLIHGGYWRALSKDGFLFPARPLAENGVISVAVDYALCPSVSMSELLEQCRRALRWVVDNIAAYGGDPERLHCTGHSAGAHLSTMLALDVEFSPRIKSVMAVSGLYELSPLLGCSMQADLRLSETEVAALSPLRLAGPRAGQKFIFAVGGAETQAFRWNTHAYAAHCLAQGGQAELIEVPEQNHYSVIGVLHQDDAQLQEAWLAATLG